MADSGTYSPETIARRQKIADTLLMQAMKPRDIRTRLEGVGQLGESAIAGWQSGRAERDEKTARNEAVAQALAAFGGGGGGQTPTAPAGPAAAPMSAPGGDQPPPAAVDASLPRGLRNNNPLNIEAGGFTQGQPGFSGSDGRFAKFDTPEAGIGAANKLLDSYGKRGLNTPAGIIGRWAPSADNNNVPAYAQAVAAKLGIGPNDQIPPEMRPQLIAAMGQHENGRPIGDVAAALQGRGGAAPSPGGPSPTAAPAVAAALQGGAGAPSMQGGLPPQQVAQNAPAATAGPLAGVQGNQAAIVKMLMNPWTPPELKSALVSQMNPSYGFQTLPDGTIVRTNPKTGQVEPVYQAATKPTFGQVGEDATGGKQYGFVDPNKRTVEPYKPPGSGQPVVINDANGNPLTVPAGQDPKKFREHVTTATADAMSGKLTEAQTNATQFANRMEDAERNVGPVEGQGTEPWNKAADVAGGWSSYLRSTEGQKYAQAKSQFITAQLRKESGAAISKTEFDRYDREFFPQPGDSKEVVDQKRAARKVSIEAMKKGAGPMYKSPEGAAGPVKVTSPEEARKLPSGTKIILPDGSPGTVP